MFNWYGVVLAAWNTKCFYGHQSRSVQLFPCLELTQKSVSFLVSTYFANWKTQILWFTESILRASNLHWYLGFITDFLYDLIRWEWNRLFYFLFFIFFPLSENLGSSFLPSLPSFGNTFSLFPPVCKHLAVQWSVGNSQNIVCTCSWFELLITWRLSFLMCIFFCAGSVLFWKFGFLVSSPHVCWKPWTT